MSFRKNSGDISLWNAILYASFLKIQGVHKYNNGSIIFSKNIGHWLLTKNLTLLNNCFMKEVKANLSKNDDVYTQQLLVPIDNITSKLYDFYVKTQGKMKIPIIIF